MRRQITDGIFNQTQNQYLLYDDFSTPRVAGSVNGSYAEFKGGVRTVVDGNNVLSMSGDKLVAVTGGVTTGNPIISYSNISRILGRTYFAKDYSMTTSSWGAEFMQQGGGTTSGTLMEFSNISVRAGAGGLVVAPFSLDTLYSLCIIFRISGTFTLIKGGVYSNWTMLYPQLINNSALISTNIQYRSTTAEFSLGSHYIPLKTFIPIPIQSDGFSLSTTDGLGNPENNGIVGNSWTGATWSVGSGVVSNTPSVGAQIHNQSNAAADPNGTEANATTGWTATNSTLSVDSLTPSVGTYDLKAVATAPFGSMDYGFSATATTWYAISANIKQTIETGFCAILTSLTPQHNPSATSSWATYYFNSRATTTTPSISFKARGTIGDIVQVDDVSIKSMTLSSLFRSISSSSQNVIVDVNVIRTLGTQAGLVLNLDSTSSPSNFVIAYLDGAGNCILEKCVAGVYTSVISGAVTYVSSATLRVIKDGTSYRLFYNDLAVGSVGTISDAGIINNTLHGLFSTYDLNTFDNFVIWARGTNNEYSALDSM